MLAAIFHGPGQLDVTEVEKPEIGSDEVLVRVGANTVCGTDARIMSGEKTRGIRRPSIIGHEFAGRVAEVGADLEGWEPGTAVAMSPMIPCRACFYCRRDMENACPNKVGMGFAVDGGLSEYVRIPALAIRTGNLFRVSDELPPEHLALAEPLSCCIKGQSRTPIGLEDTVLILGAGPIGLLHLQLALLCGAGTVIVSEPSASRRRFASDLGAHLTVDPTEEDLPLAVGEATGGLGVDVGIVCVGQPRLVNDALRLARKGGSVNVFAGLSGDGWAEIEANLIHYNELLVTGSSDARRADYEKALRLIETNRIDVDRMLTHRFPLTEVNRAIETATNGESIKVAVLP